MLDEYGMPVHRGRLAGLEPQGHRVLQGRPDDDLADREARGVRLDPPPRRTRAEDDPNLRELVAAETPVVTIFGKSWLLHVTEVLGATPQENLDMVADSRPVHRRARAASSSTTPSTSSTATSDDRDYALSTLRAAREAGARTLVLCDTNGGTLTDELRRGSSATSAARSRATPDGDRARHLGHPHPQRRRARGRQLDRRGRGRHPPRPGDDQRLRRARPATRTWSRSSPNLALKTTHELVPAGGGDLAGLTELSRSVAEIANVSPNDWQPYVGRSAFAHKGGVHGAAVAKVERSYQHVDPTAVGNAGPARRVASSAAGRTPGSGPSSSATSSRASSTRRS